MSKPLFFQCSSYSYESYLLKNFADYCVYTSFFINSKAYHIIYTMICIFVVPMRYV